MYCDEGVTAFLTRGLRLRVHARASAHPCSHCRVQLCHHRGPPERCGLIEVIIYMLHHMITPARMLGRGVQVLCASDAVCSCANSA